MRWLAALVGLGTACGGSSGPDLRLLEFRQHEVEVVALNEELVFFFSAPLDASSVTSDSVRVVDEEGLEARGERRVRGNALTFQPALPCARDLSDGGFRPKRRYQVILGGFPRPDGLRSVEGGLLSSGLVLSFATAGPGDPSPLFVETFLGPFRLQPRGKAGGHAIELEDGQLVLEYGEALDPSSVPGCRFRLLPSTPGSAELATTVALSENRRDFAALRLVPLGPDGSPESRLPGGTYFLTMQGAELLTLGGRRVEPGWSLLELSVPPARVEIELSGARDLAEERPQGCDGTARWDEGRGALSLRYPAAAGRGTDGPAGASALPGARDLHATRIEVEAGSTADLSGLSGPIVLRSQSSLHVRGQLLRRATSPGARIGAGPAEKVDPLTDELLGMAGREPGHWSPLSPWIERLLTPNEQWSEEPWTVLVAGGDLWIPAGGVLEVEGHLVLVAGGQIRVEGRALARANLWRTGEGLNLAAHGRNRELPLLLDEPARNPLRVPFTVGALTRALPWTPEADGWRTWLVGQDGIGRLSATLVAEPPRPEREGHAASPGALRFLVRLEIEPGEAEAWDPPALERIEVEGLGLAPGRPGRP